jgi:hypothetical protein
MDNRGIMVRFQKGASVILFSVQYPGSTPTLGPAVSTVFFLQGLFQPGEANGT